MTCSSSLRRSTTPPPGGCGRPDGMTDPRETSLPTADSSGPATVGERRLVGVPPILRSALEGAPPTGGHGSGRASGPTADLLLPLVRTTSVCHCQPVERPLESACPAGSGQDEGSGSGDVPGEKIGRPMRCYHTAVGEKFSSVVEENDPVAEQAPTLLRVERNSVRGFPVGSVRRRTWRLVRAHRRTSRFVRLARGGLVETSIRLSPSVCTSLARVLRKI
jgi:hypothetical protein